LGDVIFSGSLSGLGSQNELRIAKLKVGLRIELDFGILNGPIGGGFSIGSLELYAKIWWWPWETSVGTANANGAGIGPEEIQRMPLQATLLNHNVVR
jgi:hypothetical protein